MFERHREEKKNVREVEARRNRTVLNEAEEGKGKEASLPLGIVACRAENHERISLELIQDVCEVAVLVVVDN